MPARSRARAPSPTVSFGDPAGDEADGGGMGYQQTLMYGRYAESLGDYAKEEAKRQRINEKIR